MRLIAWNVAHQTRSRPLAYSVGEALAELRPDVVVLTEYVYSAGHTAFLDALAQCGLRSHSVSNYVPGENQVLIASRARQTAGPPLAVGLSPATTPNYLHIRLDSATEVIGLRQPMFKGVSQAAGRYWSGVRSAAEPIRHGAAVIMGDFNCSSRAHCLRPLLDDGWRVVTPPTGWSYFGQTGATSAIDHALLSPSLQASRAEYLVEAGGIVFAGRNGGVSDHSLLIVDTVPRSGISSRAS